jgi:ectoine hydroxylase-related dioxygenase (phytanoyl-CoA dioxygenase family)
MTMIPGSHMLGERLPVDFAAGNDFMEDEWSGVESCPQDPVGLGFSSVDYALQPGECGIHHAMVWHGSPKNTSNRRRVVYTLRYLAEGTIWMGGVRIPYDDIGCPAGEPVTRHHFPLV